MVAVKEYRIGELERAIEMYFDFAGAVQGTPCHLHIAPDYIAWGIVDMEQSTIDSVEFEDDAKHSKLYPMKLQEALSELFMVNHAVKVHSELTNKEILKGMLLPLRYLVRYNIDHGVLIRTFGRPADELVYEKDGEYISRIDVEARHAIGLTSKNSMPLVELYKYWKPMRIIAELDQYALGQIEAKRALARCAYWHLQRIYDIEKTGNTSLESQSMLLLGPTGAGKTLLAKKLGEILGLPFVVRDATALTSAGIVGDDIEDYMKEMWEISGGNLKRLQYGIFLIDEIDKTASHGYGEEVNGKGAQARLLRFTEGSRIFMETDMRRFYPGPKYLDSSHNMKIFSGSFMGKGMVGIEDIIKKRISPSSLGFGSEILKPSELLAHVIDEDLLKFGILRELAARMTIKASVKELSIDELQSILTVPRGSIVEQYKRSFELDGHSLHFEPDALELIAKEAKKRGSNARSLRPVVDLVLGPMQEKLAGEEPTEIGVTKKNVEDALGKG